MLVLTRRWNERIMIDGGRIVITVIGLGPHGVNLGIEAPQEVRVDREEIHLRRMAEEREEVLCRL